MKTLCPKPGKGAGNGKIHHPSSAAEDPVRAAFRLLPAAILVLVSGLGQEDREVLAYLVTVPVELGMDAAAAAAVPLAEQPAARSGAGRIGRRRVTPPAWCAGHPPTHGCGCFDCYMSFWARWDGSPERDRIQDVLEAFEEHLLLAAAAESSATTPPSSSSRRRERRGRLASTTPPPPPPPLPISLRWPKNLVVEAIKAPVSAPSPAVLPPQPPSKAPAAPTAEEEEEEVNVVPEPAPTVAEAEECLEVAADATEEDEERKRGWAGVMGGVLGLRGLWGIWSPAVESATWARDKPVRECVLPLQPSLA